MIAKVDIDSLRVGDSNISPVSVARNLGSWFDPMLIMKTHSSVFRGGHAAMPPRNVRKHFLTRYTVKNGISNLYILLKSALKMQEMPFQRPKFQNISGGACPRTTLELCRHYGHTLTKILATY